MKRALLVLTAVCLMFLCCSCGENADSSVTTPVQQVRDREELNSRTGEFEQMIGKALNVLKEGWKEEYKRFAAPGSVYTLDIRGLRIIKIKDRLEEKEEKIFGDIRYLVEFLFYDDYYSY